MNILSFDTGKNIGWNIINIYTQKLLKYGCKQFELSSIGEYCNELWWFLMQLYDDILYPIDIVRIEEPEYYGGKKGTISLKRGDLFYVQASAITLYNFYSSHMYSSDIKVELVTPCQWKGNLSKEATENRVKLILGDQVNHILKMPKYKREHIIDSIGIGLSYDKKLWELRK